MGEIEKINNTELSVKVYRNQRVVTFKDIDTVHERPEGTARKRFNDNKKHFIEGEDFYKVKCGEVRPFFGHTLPNGFNPDADINLITESGYLMLVKSFTDDLAWDVQRQLVKSYFRKRTAMDTDKLTITSRELTILAKEKRQAHHNIMFRIKECITELQEMGQNPDDYFMESEYWGGNNEMRPQYLVTEQGCEYYVSRITLNRRNDYRSEYLLRFDQLRAIAEGKPLSKPPKLPRLISMEDVEEKEPQIQLYKTDTGGIVLLDGEVFSLMPDEIEALSRFIPEMQKYNIGQIQYAVSAFLKSMKKSGKLEKVASWGVGREVGQREELPDKEVHRQKLHTDSSVDLNSIENLSELQAKTRYSVGRNNLLKIADEAGAVVKVGVKRLYSRRVLDDYFKRHTE